MTGNRDGLRRGVVFPQGSIGADPGAIREFTAGITEAGFDHLVAPDHVLGADPAAHPGWHGVYDVHDAFHEPLTLFAFIAGFSSLELVTGVLVLPQRQAALVAKQAAEVDILTGGRFRLGVGIGWNEVEYQGMGADFRTRGRRIVEQIDVMRALWTGRTVHFTGSWHEVDGAGIAPLPVQRPIPVWMGAEADHRAFVRLGQVADGWIALGPPRPEAQESLAVIHRAAEQAGRDPASIGVEAWVDVADGDLGRIGEEVRGWQRLGATHVAFSSRGPAAHDIHGHLRLLRQAAKIWE